MSLFHLIFGNPVSLVFVFTFGIAIIIHIHFYRNTNRLYKSTDTKIRNYFGDLLRTIEGAHTPESSWSLNEYLRHVIDDIQNVLARDPNDSERSKFINRYKNKRETRTEINSLKFSTSDNLTRRMIEIYPPIGICGTVVSLFLSVQRGDQGDVIVDQILGNFMTAMWTTILGLVLWIGWTLIYAKVECRWERIPEAGEKARDIIWDIDRAIGGPGGADI